MFKADVIRHLLKHLGFIETQVIQYTEKREPLGNGQKQETLKINHFEGLRKFGLEPGGPDGTRTRDLCRDRAAF